MDAKEFLKIVHLAEKLKDTPRHSYTSGGRRESVAEHCWRIALMALFLSDEFPQADLNRVMRMCLIHDLGEAFTGDIPTFLKTDEDEARERILLNHWVESLPEPFRREMQDLYGEMEGQRSLEARIYKALDKMEAVIQHNEADISTWLENEYDLNLHHAEDAVAFSPYLTALRQCIREETIEKIARASNPSTQSAEDATAH